MLEDQAYVQLRYRHLLVNPLDAHLSILAPSRKATNPTHNGLIQTKRGPERLVAQLLAVKSLVATCKSADVYVILVADSCS